ncbi:iron-sulfur cluster repair di-iron protein [soil metagenome]
MTINPNQPLLKSFSVSDIALSCPEALEVLNRYNLDYCCGGKLSFVEVCDDSGLDAESIWEELQDSRAASSTESQIPFEAWDVQVLMDFIVQHHHGYVKSAIPRIHQLLDKVCEVHGTNVPELFQIREGFEKLADELTSHLVKEEEELFPGIRELFTHRTERYYKSDMGLQELTDVVEHEHDLAGNLLKSIRTLTNNYDAQAVACPTFKATYIQLSEFEKDLMKHIHLENNILFMKVKTLYQ